MLKLTGSRPEMNLPDCQDTLDQSFLIFSYLKGHPQQTYLQVNRIWQILMLDQLFMCSKICLIGLHVVGKIEKFESIIFESSI